MAVYTGYPRRFYFPYLWFYYYAGCAVFFFAVLFYFFYQKYIDNDTWLLALALSVVTACMLYSKYHAVLLIAFTVVSNVKLLKRGSFWLIVILAAAYICPAYFMAGAP